MLTSRPAIIAGITFTVLLLFFSLHSPSQAAVKQAAQNVHSSVIGATRPEREPVCKWVFERYESSEYEREWLDLTAGGVNDNVCKVVREPSHAKRCFQIVERVASLVNIPSSIKFDIPDSAGPEPEHRDDQLFSKFYYKRECYDDKASAWRPATGLGIQLIEPLFGMLRDPFDSWCGEDALDKLQEGFPPSYSDNNRGQSKNHIMPQGFAPYAYTLDGSMPQTWRQHGTPPWFKSLKAIKTGNQVTFRTPQVIHLDLGSSYFGGWSMYGGERNTAASGQWFYDTYQGRGNPFDRFTAVELEKLDPDEAFKQVPEDLIGKYSLMNIGLSMDKDKFNTLELIRRTVSEEDFFVFKLDIDSAPIEMPIVNALLADDPKNGGASALIDELMFEHHCKFYPMAATWNLENADPEKEGNLASSYKLFRDLRLKGIRAHSWP